MRINWDALPELFTCARCCKLRHKTWLRFVGAEKWCSMCTEERR